MSNYKICVYAICKNEEQFVDRWMNAVKEADLVIVSDTGSTDNTVEKLKQAGAEVYCDTIDPWRFDAARNTALSHVPEDFDICVSNDLDEIFEPGWRKKLEEAWQPHHTRASYTFVWERDENDQIIIQFAMEKIHRRHGYKWVHPVHEVLEFNGTEETVSIPTIVLNHYPDNSKPRSQYLPLLELSGKENPTDPQVQFWLGREQMYYHKFDSSIQTLLHYLDLPSALWEEERSAAMRYISNCYIEKNEPTNAQIWAFKAVSECPFVREPYLHLAKLSYLQEDWPLVAFMVNEALKITEKTNSYLCEAQSWGYPLYDFGAIACYWLGQYGTAKNYALKALELAPDDERLKQNLLLIEQKISQNDEALYPTD